MKQAAASVARAHAPQAAPSRSGPESAKARAPIFRAGNRAVTRWLGAAFSVTQPNDAHEREAQRLSSALPNSSVARLAVPEVLDGSRLSAGGEPLAPSVRSHYEHRLGLDLETVRVHTGATAAGGVAAFGARALAYGNHVWLGRGQSAEPSATLAHELAHVYQYARTGELVVAREEAADPDANVSLGELDSDLATKVGDFVLGPAHFAVLREFLRGAVGGYKAAPPEQVARIKGKFKHQTTKDKWEYAKGYGEGILLGLWEGLKGLFEALVTLAKLPFQINQFLYQTMPELAAKYGPRLLQLFVDGTTIQARIAKVLSEILQDPKKALAQFDKAVEEIKQAALSKVRAVGHSAAEEILGVLDLPWKEFGLAIGKIVGRVLFEVILLVASEAIANAVKAALSVAAKVAARLVGTAVELIADVARVARQAMAFLANLGRRFTGAIGEAIEWLNTTLKGVAEAMETLGREPAFAGVPKGFGAEAKGLNLESRMVKPPEGTVRRPLSDYRTPKVHPSNVAKEAEAAGKGEGAVAKAPAKQAATFGKAATKDYAKTFFASHPELDGTVVVHHAVERQTLTRFPGTVTEAQLHSLENLRGIPKAINPEVHLSKIRIRWNEFYRKTPNPTVEQLLEYATKIDDEFGHLFTPPVR